MSYAHDYLREAKSITGLIDPKAVEKMVDIILIIRENKGRLFFLGVGGVPVMPHMQLMTSGNCRIESYSPTDNVSELTARINDDGWESTFSAWLKGSNLNSKDGVFVFSVGGGNREKNVSVNLVKALEYANKFTLSIRCGWQRRGYTERWRTAVYHSDR